MPQYHWARSRALKTAFAERRDLGKAYPLLPDPEGLVSARRACGRRDWPASRSILAADGTYQKLTIFPPPDDTTLTMLN